MLPLQGSQVRSLVEELRSCIEKKKERWEAKSEQRMKRIKKSINSESFSKRIASPPWIPWTEEPGRLQSMGSQRVRHD